jgi:single-strand DNA-binding protein
MYQNKVILMGFLGKDAEVRTGNNNRNFTTLSIATKSSYKDKESGEYISRTEWHNCIVFGKLAEFAGTLKKGAHIQLEDRDQAAVHAGPGNLHPEAGPGRKGRSGR